MTKRGWHALSALVPRLCLGTPCPAGSACRLSREAEPRFQRVPRQSLGTRSGAFTLLEVVLALAILTVALTACLALIDVGLRNARDARDQTRAQELCESVMSLIVSGILQPNDVQGEGRPISEIWSQANLPSGVGEDTDLQAEEEYWLVSVLSEPATMQDMLQITVTVSGRDTAINPPSFTLVRWLRDPLYVESLGQNAASGASR
jgi:prepilin-type N-terminal cleavage/methylation domain-containing protein